MRQGNTPFKHVRSQVILTPGHDAAVQQLRRKRKTSGKDGVHALLQLGLHAASVATIASRLKEPFSLQGTLPIHTPKNAFLQNSRGRH